MGLKLNEIQYEMKIQVIDGDYKGRQITQQLSINHENDTVAKIARSTLKSLYIALNVNLDNGGIKDLINKPVMFEFGHYTPKTRPGEASKAPRLTIRKIYAKDSSPVAKTVINNTTTTETASKPGWGSTPSWSK